MFNDFHIKNRNGCKLSPNLQERKNINIQHHTSLLPASIPTKKLNTAVLTGDLISYWFWNKIVWLVSSLFLTSQYGLVMNNEYIAAKQDSIIIKRKQRSTKNKTVAQLNEKGMQNTQGLEKKTELQNPWKASMYTIEQQGMGCSRWKDKVAETQANAIVW